MGTLLRAVWNFPASVWRYNLLCALHSVHPYSDMVGDDLDRIHEVSPVALPVDIDGRRRPFGGSRRVQVDRKPR